MAAAPELQAAFLKAHAAGDKAAAGALAAQIRLQSQPPAPVAPVAKPADVGGFFPAASQSLGSLAKYTGTALEDMGLNTGLGAFGQGVIDRNPTAVHSLGDIAENPWGAVKEAVGQFTPDLGIGAGLARSIAATPLPPALKIPAMGAGMLAPGFIKAFGADREGGVDIAPALASAGIQSGLELLGPEAKILRLMGGKDVLKEGAGRIASIGKSLLTNAGIEGATEPAQQIVSDLFQKKDPFTAAGISDKAFQAAMGAIGGATAGAVTGAMTSRAKPPETQEAPPAAPEEDEDAVSEEDIQNLVSGRPLAPPVDLPGAPTPDAAVPPTAPAPATPPAPAPAVAPTPVPAAKPAAQFTPNVVRAPDGNPFKTTFQAGATLRTLPEDVRKSYAIMTVGPGRYELRQRGTEGLDAGFIPTAPPESVDIALPDVLPPDVPTTEGIEVEEVPSIELASPPDEIAAQQKQAADTQNNALKIERLDRMIQDADALGDPAMAEQLRARRQALEPQPQAVDTAGIEVTEDERQPTPTTEGISVGEVAPVTPPAKGFAVDPFGNTAGAPSAPSEVTSRATRAPEPKALPAPPRNMLPATARDAKTGAIIAPPSPETPDGTGNPPLAARGGVVQGDQPAGGIRDPAGVRSAGEPDAGQGGDAGGTVAGAPAPAPVRGAKPKPSASLSEPKPRSKPPVAESAQAPTPTAKARVKPGEAAKARLRPAPHADDLVTFLRKNGGLQNDVGEVRGRLKHLNANNRTFGLAGIERNGYDRSGRRLGMTLDQAAELATEAGYIQPSATGYDQRALLDALERAEDGTMVWSDQNHSAADDAMRRRDEELTAQDEDRGLDADALDEAMRQNHVPDSDRGELSLIDQAERMLGPDAIERLATQFEDDDAGFFRALDEAIYEQEGSQSDQDGTGGALGVAESEAQGRRRAGNEGPEVGFSLSAQTEEDLRTRDQQQKEAGRADAAEQKSLKEREAADRDRNDFTLTGSSRVADVAMAGGQRDIFGAASQPKRRAVSEDISKPADGDLLQPAFDDRLAAVHNTNAERLMHADRMGGFAAPSLAIMRPKDLLTGFGDITLVAPPGLIDPKSNRDAKVFGADVYSPRYPEVTYKLSPAAQKKLGRALGTEIYGGMVDSLRDLTDMKQFRSLADKELGEGRNYRETQALAEKMLRDAGADEKLFQGYSNSGDRRYKPHTLENVVKEIKKNIRGGENWNYGGGSVRAAYTPQFRSIKQIKKEQGRLVSAEDFAPVKDEVNEELVALATSLAPFHPSGKSFGFSDTVGNTLADASKMGMARAFRENGFESIPPGQTAEAAKFIGKLRTLPTEYFEAKITRGVDIEEFRTAVVPDNTPQAARDIIRRRGLRIVEYRKGDEAHRRQVVEEAARADDNLFQPAAVAARITASTPPPSVRHWASVNPKGERGAAVVREALTKAKDQNTIRPETADMALWLLDRNPNLAADLAVAIRPGLQGVAGSYNPPNRLITLFSGSEKPDTAVHEILHHSERMMPEDVQKAIHAEWRAAVDREMKAAAKAGDTKRLAAISALQRYNSDLEARALADFARRKGILTPEDYALANASEYWAVNATRILSERYAADSWQARAAQWLRDFIERVRSILNLPPDDPILRGLRAVLKASGEQVSGQQLNRRNADAQQPAGAQTETPAFKKWFGQSVVTENGKAGGKPQVVYHGSHADFEVFDAGEFGFHLGNENAAELFGEAKPYYLSIQNPFFINKDLGNWKPEALLRWLVSREYTGPGTGIGTENEAKAIRSVSNLRKRNAAALRDPDDTREYTRALYAVSKPVRDLFIARGYDGIRYRNEGEGGYSYIAFRPEQIKSAIGNTGAFDPSDPNILYQPAAGRQSYGPNPSAAPLTESNAVETWTRRLADNMNRVLKAQETIKTRGGTITDAKNVYVKETLSKSKARIMADALEKQYMEPALKLMKQAKLSLKDVDDWLMAKHAVERNALVATRNPKMPDGGSGMKNAEAAQILASQAGLKRANLEAISNAMNQLHKQKLDMLEKYGVLSAADVKALKGLYQNYVPLKTIDIEADLDPKKTGQGIDIRGQEFQMAMGRGSRATSPFLTSFQDYGRSIIRSVKNDVGHALYELAKDPAAKGIVEIADPAEFTIRTTDKDGQVVTQTDPSWTKREEVFATKIDGETKYVVVRDPLMMDQIKKLGDVHLAPLLQNIGQATSLFGRLLTQYNPTFGPVNAIRDALQASILSLAIPGVSPANVLSKIPGTFSAIIRGDSATGKTATYYKEFKEDGGSTNSYGLSEMSDLFTTIEADGLKLGYDRSKPGFAGAVQRAKLKSQAVATHVGRTKFAKGLSLWNEAFENGTRLATYIAARDAGKTRQEAAYLSKELSTNFNKKGELGAAMNAAFVFMNATMQSNRALAKFFKASPKVQFAVYALVAAGVLQDMLGASMGGEDDDTGEKKIDLLSEYLSDHNLVMPLESGRLLTLPLPYGLNLPFLVGRRVSKAIRTGDIMGNILGIFAGAIDTFSPIGGFEPVKDKQGNTQVVASAAKTLTPTLAKPFAEIGFNSNFMGGPIYKAPYPNDKNPLPRWVDHKKDAAGWATAMSKVLNNVTGGDDIERGAVDLSPEVIEYIPTYYSGGVGRLAINAANIIEKMATGQTTDVELRRIPFLNSFLREPSKSNAYQRYQKIAEQMAIAEDLSKAGRQVDTEDRKVLPQYEAAEKRLNGMLRQLKAAKTDEQRRAIQERMDETRSSVIRLDNIIRGKYEPALSESSPKEAADAFRQAGKPAAATLFESVQ